MCVQSLLLDYLSSTRFQTELAITTHVTVSGIRSDVSKIREEVGGQVHLVRASSLHSVDEGECLQLQYRLTPGQKLQLSRDPVPYV